MRAAILQYGPAYLDVSGNLDDVEKRLDHIDADLIVLPEFFATGYHFKSMDDVLLVAESIDEGPTTARLRAWAINRGCVVVAGLPEREDEACYNSAVVVGPAGTVGVYRKNHLYYRENTYFTPGNKGFPVFDVETRDGLSYRLGVMICFDWYYPEAARSLTLAGADVIAHPSNLVRKDCPRSMPIRALENHVFTITANRIGREEAHGEVLEFIGQSVICDPNGETLFSAPREDAVVGTAEFDPLAARNRQITPFNDLLTDRRPLEYLT